MNAQAWLMQRVTAVILLGTLGLHIAFLHYGHGHGPLRFDDIMLRLSSPVFIILDLLLLLCGLYHVTYGLYSIFLDFGPEVRSRVVVLASLVGVGLGLTGFGLFSLLFFK